MSLPLAQVELMAIDQSIIVYPKTDKVEMAGGKSRTFTRPDQAALDEANDHWSRLLASRKRNRQNQPTTENSHPKTSKK